ncbi:MAG: hypothetical protein WC344_05250 [Bacilli bacterium]|jgi:hypothetical protein
MTTAVFSAIPKLHSKVTFICGLLDTTPDEAISRLKKAGIIALEDEADPAAIIIIGYRYEVITSIDALIAHEKARAENKTRKRITFTKQRRLSLAP